jgi:plasmid maintenance system antidote protein VapI
MAKKLSLEDRLRELVTTSGMTQNGMAKATGVPQPVLWKFIHGLGTINLPTVERLADYFDLELVRRQNTASSR